MMFIRNQISIFLVALVLVAASIFADEKQPTPIVKVSPEATLTLGPSGNSFMLLSQRKEIRSSALFTRTYTVKRNDNGSLEIRLTEITRTLSQPPVCVREHYLLITGTAEKYQAVYVMVLPHPWPPRVAGLKEDATQNLFKTVASIFRFADIVQKNMSMLPAQPLFDRDETLKRDISVILNLGIGLYIRILPREDARK